MLKLWAGTDSKIFNRVVGKVLQGQDIEHKRIKLDDKLPKLNDGDVCLGYGGKALAILQKAGIVPKGRSITSQREIEFPVNGGKACFMLSFDPGIVNVDYGRKPEIEWDTRLAMRKVLTGKLEPEIGHYEYVKDFSEAIAYVKAMHKKTGKHIPIAADLETIGLSPHVEGVRIVSIAITYAQGQADVIYFKKDDKLSKKLRKQLEWLFNSNKIITRGANFKFDKVWMMVRWGLTVTNDKFDSLLVGSLLDENRNNDLNLHAKIFTTMGGYDDPLNRKYDKSRMDLVPKEDLLPYAGGDTDACYRTANHLKAQLLKDKWLTNFYVKLLQPAAQVFSKVEYRGMVVDLQRYEDLKVEVQAELDRLEAEVFGMMPRRLRLKYADNLSLTRDVILREFLFTEKGLNLTPQILTEKAQLPSCAMEHLEMFADNPDAKEFVDLLRQFNSATKTMGTYIVGFMKHLRPDGKFHPTYMLHRGTYEGDDKESGAVTGRTSAKDPAVQTIPKHTIWTKPLRSVYVPPPGYVILQADYSQGELRVAACVAEEPTMIKAYQGGIDLHSVTAAKLAGYTFEAFMKLPEDVRDEYRYGGKAGNFGLLYGMGWAGFQIYAKNTYGVTLTEKEAQEFRDAFFELYAGLATWHSDIKKFAHAQGYVRSPLGRVRHLPLINTFNNEVRAKQERQAINSPIQSTLSDMCQLAMVELDRRYPDLWIFGMTHDSIAMYVPEDEIDQWAVRVKEVMENLPLNKFNWNPPLQFISDVEMAATNMAELKPWSMAA